MPRPSTPGPDAPTTLVALSQPEISAFRSLDERDAETERLRQATFRDVCRTRGFDHRAAWVEQRDEDGVLRGFRLSARATTGTPEPEATD